MMCGTCSNENAIKMMFMKYMHKQRNGRVEFNSEEIESTMLNQSPGSKQFFLTFHDIDFTKKILRNFTDFFFLLQDHPNFPFWPLEAVSMVEPLVFYLVPIPDPFMELIFQLFHGQKQVFSRQKYLNFYTKIKDLC